MGFDFYDQVWYWDTLSEEKGVALPGGWIVISHRVRVVVCYWLLNKQGNVISQSTVQDITKEDLTNPTLKETLELDDKKIKKKLTNEKHKLESYLENKLFQEDIILDEEEDR